MAGQGNELKEQAESLGKSHCFNFEEKGWLRLLIIPHKNNRKTEGKNGLGKIRPQNDFSPPLELARWLMLGCKEVMNPAFPMSQLPGYLDQSGPMASKFYI